MAKRRRSRRSRGFRGTPEQHGGAADLSYNFAIREAEYALKAINKGDCGEGFLYANLTSKALGRAEGNRQWGMVDASLHERADDALRDVEAAFFRKCVINK